MSTKKYIEASVAMNRQQHEAMLRLYDKGTNHDGHTWVTFSDVEDAVADIIMAGSCGLAKAEPEPELSDEEKISKEIQDLRDMLTDRGINV